VSALRAELPAGRGTYRVRLIANVRGVVQFEKGAQIRFGLVTRLALARIAVPETDGLALGSEGEHGTALGEGREVLS
jgi:hypothetical protein